jgi:RHS repeat-associated protein
MFCCLLKKVTMPIGAIVRGLIYFSLLAFVFLVDSDSLSAQSVLVGNQSIESNIDSNAIGLAEAFPVTATASGQVGSINFFLDPASAATKIYLGIYTNTNGHPGTLLTQGSITQFARGTWNTVPVSPVNVTSGTAYWIAILGTTGGIPVFRDRSTTACHSQTSSQSNLTSLPGTWSTGQTWNTCYISAYAVSNTLAATVMIGNQAVEASLDKNPAGRAEAFSAVANTTGTVGTIALYLDPTSGSGPVFVGLYADNNGHPGTLLGQGSTTQPVPGSWNQISIARSSITAGHQYWIAVLGTSATSPYFRDRQTSSCHSETTPQSTLTSLPATWSTGSTWATCYISAYGLPAASSPVLSISSANLSFAATQGGANPAPANLSVTNTGTGSLNFTVSSDASWLSATPASGTAPQTIQVSASVGSLAPGTYTGHVTVTAAGAQGSPAAATVTFTVAPFIPPSITASASPAPNSSGWNKSNVTVTFTCVAGTYPLRSCAPPVNVSAEGANQSICGQAVDTAGNNSAPACATVSLDKTPPSITATISPAPNANGINTTIPVTITFTCSDTLSGIAVCPSPISVTTTGSNQVFGGTATDKAGNTAAATATLNIQTAPPTPPSIAASISPAPNANGWDNSPVTVSFTCVAGTNPVATCPAPLIVSTEGANQSICGKAIDTTGLSATACANVNLDKTPPTITAVPSPSPLANTWNTTPVTVTFTCADSLSGVAICPPPQTVSTDGFHQVVSGTATDVAGNVSGSAQVTLNIDQTPPSILQFTAPAQLAPGQSGTAAVNATDNIGVAAVVIQLNGATVATLTTAPYSTTFTAPTSANAGDTLTLTASVFDLAGNVSSSARGIQIVPTGVVTGQVLSDATGLPFMGATVQVLGASAQDASDNSGRYSIASNSAHLFLAISSTANATTGAPAMVTVEREVFLQAGVGTVPVDARMTQIAAAIPVNSAGGSLMNGSITVSIAPGAVSSATNFHLTSLSQQGLPGLLPLGWSPIAAFDLRADTSTSASFTASLAQLPNSVVFHLVHYDYNSHSWLMVTPSLGAASGTLTIPVPSVGEYALVTPDSGNTSLTVPSSGQALMGVSMVALPAGAAATGALNPPSVSPTGGTSSATLTLQSSVPLPSGTVIQAKVQDRYSLASGKQLSQSPRLEDIILYQFAAPTGAAAAASFPVTPAQTFQPGKLASGDVHLDILSGRESVRGQVGGSDSASVTGGDATLTISAGSLPQDTAISVAPESVDTFLPSTSALLPLAEYNIDLSGQTLLSAAQLSVAAGSAKSGDNLVLAQLQRIQGVPYLVVVSLAQVTGSSLVTQAAPGLSGITQGGDYVFYKLTSPTGYVSGTVSTSTGPVPALVQTDSLPFVAFSSSVGSYLIVALAGPVNLSASIPNTAVAGTNTAQVTAGQTATVNITLVGQTESATITPPNGAVGVPLTAEIDITAPDAFNPVSVTASSITLTQNGQGTSTPVPVRFVFSQGATRLSVFPVSALQPSTTYTLAASGLANVLGGLVSVPTITFTTQAITPPNFNTDALVFSMPDQNGNVQVSAPPNSFPPGSTILIVDQTNGVVLSLTVFNDGSVSGQFPATIDDTLAVTVTAPDKTTATFTRSQFVAPDGTTAVGPGGGTVTGPGNAGVIIPQGALTKGTTFKLTLLDQSAFPVLPIWQGANFGSGMQIEAPSTPTFRKEVKLAFPVPANAPPGAFFYVYRRVTDQSNNIYFETIDHAFIQGTGASAQVVTASPPFCGYVNSYGSFLAAANAGFQPLQTAVTITFMMWDFDPNRPGVASQGAIVGRVFQSAPPLPDETSSQLVPVTGTVKIFLTNNPQYFTYTDSQCGTFSLFDPQFGGGTRSVTAVYQPTGQQIVATTNEVNGVQPDDSIFLVTAGLERQYRNIGRLNFTFSPPTPPPPPPEIDIQLFTLDPTMLRVPVAGIVQTGTQLVVALKVNSQSGLQVVGVAIGGTSFPVGPDSTDNPSDPRRLDFRVNGFYNAGAAGVYTITATAVSPLGAGSPVNVTKSFLVVAAGGGNTNALGQAPVVINAAPAPNATKVATSTFPEIEFSEPVTNVVLANVALVSGDGNAPALQLIGVRPDGTVVNPVGNTDSITALTIQPLTGLEYGQTYTLSLDLNYATTACAVGSGLIMAVPPPLPAPQTPQCLATYQLSFKTIGLDEIGATPDTFSSTRAAVIGDWAYLGEYINPATSGLDIVSLADPTAPADLGIASSFPGRAMDIAGQIQSPVTNTPLVAVAIGMGVVSLPSNVYFFDVSNPISPNRVAAVSASTSSSQDGSLLRIVLKDNFAYASTFNKGLQVIDIGEATAEYQQTLSTNVLALQGLGQEGQGYGMDAIVNTIPLTLYEYANNCQPVSQTSCQPQLDASGNPIGFKATMFDLKAGSFVAASASNPGASVATQTLLVATGRLPLVIADPMLTVPDAIYYPPKFPVGSGASLDLSRAPLQNFNGSIQLQLGRAVALTTVSSTDGLGNTTQHQVAVVVGTGIASLAGGQPAPGILAVVNLDDPHNPSVVGLLALTSAPSDVLINGTVAYVGTEDKLVLLVDIAAPETPTFLGTVQGDFGDRLAITTSGILVVSSFNSGIGGVVTAGLGGTPTRRPRPELGPCKECEQVAGDPINLANGNVWVTQTDYVLPGVGGQTKLSRTWNSLWSLSNPIEVIGTFGDSWRSGFDERLAIPVGTAGSDPVKFWRGDGSVWYFSVGQIAGTYSVTSPANEHATLQSDPATSTYTIQFADGTKELFNTAGYVTAFVDRNGNQMTVAYDTSNRIATVTDTAGRVLMFNYGSLRQVQSVQDPTGVVATYSYDVSGRLTQVRYADSSTVNMAYDGSGLLTSVTDANGRIFETHTYDLDRRGLTYSRANGVGAVTLSYLGNGQTQVSSSLNFATKYAVETFGGRSAVTSASGPGCATCGGQGRRSFTYDAGGNRLSIADPLGHTTRFTRDAMGNVLSRSIQVGASTITWSYSYNSFGEILTATDPLGNTTTNTYDARGNLLTSSTPSPDGAHAGGLTTYTYDSKGQALTIIDPLNNKTTISYTASGLISSVTNPKAQVTRYTYDNRGNRTSVTDPLGRVTQFTYDAMNRGTRITHPDSSTTQMAYDLRGRLISMTDGNGNSKSYAYDDADRLVSATDAANNATLYSYDGEGNLVGLTDALNNKTSFTYDSTGRPIQTVFPTGLRETYSYDAANNLASITDRNGRTTTYSYDELNRLTQKTYPDSTSVLYGWDAGSRLTLLSDASGTYQMAYDNLGRRTKEVTTYSDLPNRSFTVDFAYDADSNRTSMTDPEGGVTTYNYDGFNLLTALTDFQQHVFAFNYDLGQRRTQLSRPNGVTTTYTYTALSQLLNVTHSHGGATLDGASYTLDFIGNRTSKTNQLNGKVSTFTYDPIYRLTQVVQNSSPVEQYAYNAVGNRLSSIGVPQYNYNSLNQIASRPGASYAYDNNGNLVAKTDATGTTNYSWDFDNRLVGVTLPGGSAITFKYDPQGRRIYKQSLGSASFYVYDGVNIIEEVNSSGNPVARFTYSLGVDEPLEMVRGGITSYYEADGLGSITSLSDVSGAVSASYEYDSFGNLVASAGSLTNPFLYTAREFDGEIGLYFYRSRYYDPQLGRFISADPYGPLGEMNYYSYLGNSPVNDRDPQGLWSPGAHDRIVERALKPCGVTDSNIKLIQDGSRWFDKWSQAPVWSPEHSMLDGTTNQSPAEMRRIRDGFVNGMMNMVHAQMNAGVKSQAFFNFGVAIHPLMDSTSPQHTDDNGNPYPWCGKQGCGWYWHPHLVGWGTPIAHAVDENTLTLDLSPERQELNNQMIRSWFQRVTGQKLNCNCKH